MILEQYRRAVLKQERPARHIDARCCGNAFLFSWQPPSASELDVHSNFCSGVSDLHRFCCFLSDKDRQMRYKQRYSRTLHPSLWQHICSVILLSLLLACSSELHFNTLISFFFFHLQSGNIKHTLRRAAASKHLSLMSWMYALNLSWGKGMWVWRTEIIRQFISLKCDPDTNMQVLSAWFWIWIINFIVERHNVQHKN